MLKPLACCTIIFLLVAASAASWAQTTRDGFGMWRWGLSERQWCTLSGAEILAITNAARRTAELDGAILHNEPAGMALASLAMEAGVYRTYVWGADQQATRRELAIRSAVLNFPRGMNLSGAVHENGVGGPVNRVLARSWYEQSAAAGCEIGRANLQRFLAQRAPQNALPTMGDVCRDRCRGKSGGVYQMCMQQCLP